MPAYPQSCAPELGAGVVDGRPVQKNMKIKLGN
jgi:hypothetical protein